MNFANKAREALKIIRKAAEDKPKPYLDTGGDPIVPFGSDPKYHWWKGGQTLEQTIEELKELKKTGKMLH